MKRDLAIVGVLWLLLTVVGELLAIFVDIYPTPGSDKGEEIEHAFRVLVYVAVPVFTLVVAVLVYSSLRYRVAGPPTEDGPPMEGRGSVPLAWLAITTALAIAVMIYPGLVSIPSIFGEESDPDLVVEMEGVQWTWFVSYPQHGVSRVSELVLPVDRTVRFDISSRDVLHSFWVPAFLMKIDAVPGRTTTLSLTPTKLGTFQDDPKLRVQCAELCGRAHARMRIPVRVVTDGEFEDWVQEQVSASSQSPSGDTQAEDAQQVAIVGRDIRFDIDEIAVEAGRQVVITFDNQDDGIPHNWALYESEGAAQGGEAAIVGSPIEVGPLVQEIVFDAPPPGSYYFLCDVHPNMNGELVVE
jgi:cytochrome c oxidase subunit 2